MAGERTEEILLCSASKCINLTLVNSWNCLGDGFLPHALSWKDSDGQGSESTRGSPKADVYLEAIDPFRGLEIAFEILFSFDCWCFTENILHSWEAGFVFSHNPSWAFRLIYFFFGGSPSPPPDSSCWFPCTHLPPPCARAAVGVVTRARLTGELMWLEITVIFQQVIFHLGQFPIQFFAWPRAPTLAPQEGPCLSGDELSPSPGLAEAALTPGLLPDISPWPAAMLTAPLRLWLPLFTQPQGSVRLSREPGAAAQKRGALSKLTGLRWFTLPEDVTRACCSALCVFTLLSSHASQLVIFINILLPLRRLPSLLLPGVSLPATQRLEGQRLSGPVETSTAEPGEDAWSVPHSVRSSVVSLAAEESVTDHGGRAGKQALE